MSKKVLMINGKFRKNTCGLLVQIGKILKSHGIELVNDYSKILWINP